MMNGKIQRAWTVLAILAVLFITVLEADAYARAGFGRSFGSRGSRSYHSPSRPYSQPYQQPRQTIPNQQQTRPMANPAPQQPGSGFMRGLAGGIMGGIMGGLIGNMLFGGLARGMGLGGFGGSGIGLMEILLIGGLLYALYALFRRRKQLQPQTSYSRPDMARSMNPQTYDQPSYQGFPENRNDGNLHVAPQETPSFDEPGFKDLSMDIFFKVQAAWINRDMTPAGKVLTSEMYSLLKDDADRLKREGKINKLDNIAVRSLDVVESWSEGGFDFVTVKFLANLVDYTILESTGELVSGSRTEPVKFVEYWTFTRPAGTNAWQLSAIEQGD